MTDATLGWRRLPGTLVMALALALSLLALAPGIAQEADPAEAEAEAEAAEARETIGGETVERAERAASELDEAVEAAERLEAAQTEADGGEAPEDAAAEAADEAVVAAAEAVAEAVLDGGAVDPETGLPVAVLDPGIDTGELELRLVPLTEAQLGTLAEAWLEIVRAQTERVMAAQVTIYRTEGRVADAARARLTELAEVRKALFDKYAKIVNAWEKKGGDEAAIAKLRAYRAAIIVEETRTADAETLLTQAVAWLTDRDGGIRLAFDLAVVLVSLSGLFVVARLVRRGARRWITRVPKLSKLLQAFMVTLVYWLVLAFGLMIVLSGLGIDISPVFALIGGASFILAFAFQDTLGNLASGLMIMINRPFDEGDYADIGGTAGTVRSVSIVATTVVTPDNQVIVIPNKAVWGNVITNVTASATRRVDLTFGISYQDDIGQAIAILKETVEAHPLTLDTPEPTIVVGALGASSVDILCRPWTRTVDYWTVYWDLTRQVKERFDAAGITIPFPQQDVHIHTVSAPHALPEAPAAPQSGPAGRKTRAAAIAEGEEGYEGSGEQDRA